uniref:Mannan O-acetyltransferase 1 n=1 Tax=Amorphophallus konjac TaxID=78372 RepID=A0A346LRN9_AMOKO|nr:mannan O-acetyltransferase 1 [Amorphophallus konjac]
MVKEMRLDWSPWPLHKQNYTCAKFFVCILLIGLSFRLLFSHSGGFLPVSEPAANAPREELPVNVKGGEPQQDSSSPQKSDGVRTSIPEMALDVEDGASKKEKCDLFTGEWIRKPSGPAYTNKSCLVIEGHQNCMKNGRPDTGFLYWRWKPLGCDLPLFDAERFLDAMQNKAWAFIGDSISRNHIQSLVCLLSKADKATEVYHDAEYRSKRWSFSSYNFTLSIIWSPFLVKAEIFEDMNGVSTKDIQLHLDTLDNKWTTEFRKFDYIVIAGGKWFLKTAIYWENGTIVGCHYCPGKNLTERGFEYAYRKALNLVLHQLTSSGYNGTVLFRTSTPDHFENGEWWSGGTCNRTRPFKEGEVTIRDVDQVMRTIELEEFIKALAAASNNGMRLKLLDTTHLSLMRPDGHPGPYRQFQPFAKDKKAKVQNDCLHWCLPGPIDSWNDLIMEMALRD